MKEVLKELQELVNTYLPSKELKIAADYICGKYLEKNVFHNWFTQVVDDVLIIQFDVGFKKDGPRQRDIQVFEIKNNKRSIKEMTTDELFHIANLATGDYFNSQWSRDQKEVETGGNGWRRRVEWKMDTEGYNEYHYFEITGDSAGLDWSWSCKTTYELSKLYIGKPDWSNAHSVNTLNPAKIVDYCREQNLDIENKLR